MNLHFADSSYGNWGQYDLLADEGVASSLLSYHYALNAGTLAAFEHYWDRLLHLHLTGAVPIRDAMLAEKADKTLLSYAYRQHERDLYAPAWVQPDVRPRVIIDSGAFTAWSTGKAVTPEEYGRWALGFSARWRDRMASLRFMNLDVIGDQLASWKNQEKLEGMGLDPIPIVTYGADIKHLTLALDRYPYVALGGLVPYSQRKTKMRAWLDYCFREVLRHRDETGRIARVHLLGVTQGWVLNRYPAYSTDSSAWVSVLRFGGGQRSGLKTVPRRSEGAGARAANLHVLRSEIRRLRVMEKTATSVWRSRGVVWDD